MKSFATCCPKPFEWFEVHPDGSVFLCCPAWLKRPAGNIINSGVEDIWNGPVAREIRKSILNGSYHNCNQKRCPRLNHKPHENNSRQPDELVRSAILNHQVKLSYRPRTLNLCFDRSCNLSCTSCREGIHQARGHDLQQALKIRDILLKELIPFAVEISLSGFGDPFGSPTYLGLLEQLRQERFPDLKGVHLHSNGQLWTADVWQQLPGLQTLVKSAEISIDAATARTYEANRRGGEFQRLLDNLGFLKDLPIQLKLSMVVQQNNYREIPQLIELAKRFKAEVYLSQLVNWGTFSREEFKRRAVNLPGHHEHDQLIRVLKAASGHGPVDLGNLSDLVV